MSETSQDDINWRMLVAMEKLLTVQELLIERLEMLEATIEKRADITYKSVGLQ